MHVAWLSCSKSLCRLCEHHGVRLYMCNYHVHFSELFDVTRHCGTEQHHLFLLWTVLQEGFDLLLE